MVVLFLLLEPESMYIFYYIARPHVGWVSVWLKASICFSLDVHVQREPHFKSLIALEEHCRVV